MAQLSIGVDQDLLLQEQVAGTTFIHRGVQVLSAPFFIRLLDLSLGNNIGQWNARANKNTEASVFIPSTYASATVLIVLAPTVKAPYVTK